MENKVLVNSFISHLGVERGLSKNTLAAYRRDLEKLVSFLELKKLSLLNVELDLLRSFLSDLRSSGLSEASLARITVSIGPSTNSLREI